MDVRALIKVMRSGDVRARLTAVRDAQAAVRLATAAAGLHTGVLEVLAGGAATVDEVAGRVHATDHDLLRAFLEVLATTGVASREGDRFGLTRRGRAVLEDSMVRATYIAFDDFHTGLYRDLSAQLAGGPARDDVTRRATVIAELSEAMQPFSDALLREVVAERRPDYVLDVGCGTGRQLATMLEAAPTAHGVGIELDPEAVDLARRHLTDHGVADRAEVLTGDARELLTDVGPVDLVLLANVVYYVPLDERVDLFRAVHARVRPGGAVVVISTALLDDSFSRHFDLLLRAQEGRMELPDMRVLADQLREAGFVPGEPRRIMYGDPLTAVVADRP